MDHLEPDSLDWAITHISRVGDTDIFPVPFEYDAIRHGWTGIKDALVETDLSGYQCRPFRRFPVPKPGGAYRVAVQLDPLDTLVYTGMVYEAAEFIEKYRISSDEKVACSYRVQTDAKGQLFRSTNGWDDYQSKSQELAESGAYKYVLTADIADFYNQISHHRVRNALEEAGLPTDRAGNLESFLMSLTGGQSRGIPVGPSGSILLAEACLADVDMFLLREGYVHTRYVDDFRVFCESRADALHALHDLCHYLYTAHRLALQSSKTGPVPIDEFVERELHDPERLEERSKTEKINEILAKLYEEVEYGAFIDIELTPEDVQEVVRQNLTELFVGCLGQEPPHLGFARYLLRRATVLRTAVLREEVLGRLDVLAPVLRDAATYILKTTQASHEERVGEALIDFVGTSDLSFMPFVKLWISHILICKLATQFEESVRDICQGAQDSLGLRPLALLARELGHLDWVRAQKESWQDNRPWDRRAMIWAASALSKDERRHWLGRVQRAGDLLDRAVASAAADV